MKQLPLAARYAVAAAAGCVVENSVGGFVFRLNVRQGAAVRRLKICSELFGVARAASLAPHIS